MEDFTPSRTMDPRDPENPDHVPASELAERTYKSDPSKENPNGDDNPEENNT